LDGARSFSARAASSTHEPRTTNSTSGSSAAASTKGATPFWSSAVSEMVTATVTARGGRTLGPRLNRALSTTM
jgi:hypothetical protein